jgi:hypothetical protein
MPAQVVTAQEQQNVKVIAESFLQWKIEPGTPGNLMSKAYFDQYRGAKDERQYALQGPKQGQSRKYLQYEEQTWGINLGWTDKGDAATQERVSRWFVTRREGTKDPVTYGETIALAYGGDAPSSSTMGAPSVSTSTGRTHRSSSGGSSVGRAPKASQRS